MIKILLAYIAHYPCFIYKKRWNHKNFNAFYLYSFCHALLYANCSCQM